MRAPDFAARRGARLAYALLAACALWPSRSQAQAPAAPVRVGDVELSIADCAEIPGAQIANLVELELTPRQAGRAPDAGGPPTRAAMTCVAEHATITVQDPRRADPLVLELSLTATPAEARARFLALAVAELIATSRLERVDPATAAATTPAAVPAASSPIATSPSLSSPSPPAAPLPPDRAWWLFLEAGAVRAFEPTMFAPALTAGAMRAFLPFAVIGDVAVERGAASTADAKLTEHSVSLSLAPAWLIRARRSTFSLALGMRGGYAWLAATARRADLRGGDLSAFFFAPVASAAFQFRFANQWAARLAFECGYVIKPLRGLDADQSALLELHGVRMAALLGVAWSP